MQRLSRDEARRIAANIAKLPNLLVLVIVGDVNSAMAIAAAHSVVLWQSMPELAKEFAEATVFVLLVGKGGIGPWQTLEYKEAVDRSRRDSDFAVVPARRHPGARPAVPAAVALDHQCCSLSDHLLFVTP